ncbi:MAG TPA: acetylglutamate kinase, partial [Rhizobiaceae bacterium]|nr:acetylglutamate kinase [Rhizobiaceae bacterium]
MSDIRPKPETEADILARALPFMQRYENRTVVVKYGGHAMGDAALGKAFAQDIALLKQSGVNPVVVHGGGPQIGAMLAKMGIESRFEGGLRVTDRATVEIVEMVLCGAINKDIVQMINVEGEWA